MKKCKRGHETLFPAECPVCIAEILHASRRRTAARVEFPVRRKRNAEANTKDLKVMSAQAWADAIGLSAKTTRTYIRALKAFEDAMSVFRGRVEAKVIPDPARPSREIPQDGTPLYRAYRCPHCGESVTSKKGGPRGRPRTAIYTAEGKTLHANEWAADLGVSIQTVKNYRARFPTFDEAVQALRAKKGVT